MDIRLIVVVYLMICILPVIPSPYRSRSKSRNSAPTYDQKQTGEYNIQLHLKDFEVIALLSDSALGDLGDYDYSYDYSVLTVKPGAAASTSTQKPSTTKPEALESSTISAFSKPIDTSTPPTFTKSTTPVQITSANEFSETKTSIIPALLTSTTEKATSVQIVSTRSEVEHEQNSTKNDKNKLPIVTFDTVTPMEETQPIVVHRKCASGFTRDKQGRCRRVRKPLPQFSFGISRLASLASKLRQTNESQPNSQPTVESIEP